MNNSGKHHWYDDSSPRTEQQLEDHSAFNGQHAPPPKQAARKVVIFDRENSPQLQSGRGVQE
jgi:hypothetical protein